MAMVKHEDESDLQRKICNILNKSGYAFKKERSTFFCDIVDYTVKAFGEVKTGGKFAPQQLLYGLAKEGIDDAQYLILANEYELRVYKPPKFSKVIEFAEKISPGLTRNPSSVTEIRHVKEAFNLLGTQFCIYTYIDDFKIDEKQPCIFLDDNNYEYFQMILQKYRINPSEFINEFAKTWVDKSRLFIKNDNKTIFDQESGNEVKAHRRIMNEFDRMLIRSTRIKAENIEKIVHKIDALSPIDVRRKRGKYWSSMTVAEVTTEIVRDLVDPTFVFEPFVGGGSLVRDLVEEIPGVVNDIDGNMVEMIEREWEGFGWTFHKKNFLTTPLEDIVRNWGLLEKTDRFLIYTNPPFGTSSTNRLASREGEIDTSRQTKIQYGATGREEKYFGDKYGRGDLCLPSIGHMIEIVKYRGNGYLAFFCPFGVMLGRNKYTKVLRHLLKDFEFIYGEAFEGGMFHGINKDKSISFTVWKYHKNVNTEHESLEFIYKDRTYGIKKLPLLKDHWRYRDGIKHVKNPDVPDYIDINRNEAFSCPYPKFFDLDIPAGSGARVHDDNVKIEAGVQNVPSSLVYSLWCSLFGYHSYIRHPFPFSDCYLHLPEFSSPGSRNPLTQGILAYSVMYHLITEMKLGKTEGRIGFVGMQRVFKFGERETTAGAIYLVTEFGDLPIGKIGTIKTVFDRLKNGESPREIHKNPRSIIREEIIKLLDAIGYWASLPVPDIMPKKKKKEKTLKEFMNG